VPKAIRLGRRKEAVGLESVIDQRARAFLTVGKIRLTENLRGDLAKSLVAPMKVILRYMTWLIEKDGW
jgi:hypothetical protein